MIPVPTHHEAELLKTNEVITTAIAAGLKICFFPNAKIYFDAIAITDDHKASSKNAVSKANFGGEIMSARISAVMRNDSAFAGTLYIRAKNEFASQQMAVMRSEEKRIASELYGSMPKAATIIA